MPTATIGSLIRERRTKTKYSQMHLALDVGISARHLGFVELGRAAPSAQLLIRLANHLELPLRERNEWLLAAGYAPRYVETLLSGPELARVRCSLQSLLDAHDPYPGVAVDRAWTVQLANQGARDLFGTFPAGIGGTPINIFRLALHPDGFGRSTKHLTCSAPDIQMSLRSPMRSPHGRTSPLATPGVASKRKPTTHTSRC